MTQARAVQESTMHCTGTGWTTMRPRSCQHRHAASTREHVGPSSPRGAVSEREDTVTNCKRLRGHRNRYRQTSPEWQRATVCNQGAFASSMSLAGTLAGAVGIDIDERSKLRTSNRTRAARKTQYHADTLLQDLFKSMLM